MTYDDIQLTGIEIEKSALENVGISPYLLFYKKENFDSNYSDALVKGYPKNLFMSNSTVSYVLRITYSMARNVLNPTNKLGRRTIGNTSVERCTVFMLCDFRSFNLSQPN